ncbi:MAG: hypothetical protein V4772_08545 [Pseudomonadota bacterium]
MNNTNTNTYAIKLATGNIVYINAVSARQARIVFARANNGVIESVKVCRD